MSNRTSKQPVSAQVLADLREMASTVAVKGKLLIELIDEIERLRVELPNALLPCPICHGIEGCDHTVPERAMAHRHAVETPQPPSNELVAPSKERQILPFEGGTHCFVPEAYAWELWERINLLTRYADDVRGDCQKFQAQIERLRAALDGLVGAVGALSTPDDEFPCINEGPERDGLVEMWLHARTVLGGAPVETSRSLTGDGTRRAAFNAWWQEMWKDNDPRSSPGFDEQMRSWSLDAWQAGAAHERDRIAAMRSEKAGETAAIQVCPTCGAEWHWPTRPAEKAPAAPHNPPDGCLDCLRAERGA